MNFPVKYFHNAQQGAPAVSGTAGSLVAMLDAVLIDGFNTKTFDSLAIASNVATASISAGAHGFTAGDVILVNVTSPAALNTEWMVTSVGANAVLFATSGISDQSATGTITIKIAPVGGWSKIFSATNKAVYKSTDSAASVGRIRVDDTSAQQAQIRGYEAMTDVDTGTNPVPPSSFSTTYGIVKSSTASSTARNWWVVADSRAIHFGIQSNAFSANYFSNMIGDMNTYKAGDAYGFAYAGQTTSTLAQTTDGIGHYSQFSGRGSTSQSGLYMLRNMNNTGAASLCAKWTSACGTGGSPGTNNSVAYPALSDNGVHLHRAYISDCESQSNGLHQRRGDIPGIYYPEEYQPGAHLQKITYGGKSYITMSAIVSNSGISSNVFFSLDSWR